MPTHAAHARLRELQFLARLEREGRVDHLRMPVILHARTRPDYGAEEARIILEQLVAAAPDVPVQIAHLWGSEAFSEPALAVYAEAVASGDRSEERRVGKECRSRGSPYH